MYNIVWKLLQRNDLSWFSMMVQDLATTSLLMFSKYLPQAFQLQNMLVRKVRVQQDHLKNHTKFHSIPSRQNLSPDRIWIWNVSLWFLEVWPQLLMVHRVELQTPRSNNARKSSWWPNNLRKQGSCTLLLRHGFLKSWMTFQHYQSHSKAFMFDAVILQRRWPTSGRKVIYISKVWGRVSNQEEANEKGRKQSNIQAANLLLPSPLQNNF